MTEYECGVPGELVGALGRLGAPIETVLLAAHAKVLAALTGENEVLTGLVTEDSPVPCEVSVAEGDWHSLFRAATKARDASASPGAAYEVVLDLAGRSLPNAGTLLCIGFERAEDGGLTLWVSGRADVVDPGYAERIAGYHRTCLELMADDPDSEHHRQVLLSAAELRHQLEGLSGPRRELPARRTHELFEENVRRHPDRIAAVFGRREWSYDELNRRANRIAHVLLSRGTRAEDVVAVVTERNLDWMAAVLAIFKAGAVYLPVEPDFPAGRIAAMLSRGECRFVLTEPGCTRTLERALPITAVQDVITIADAYREGRRDTDPAVPVGAGQLAYVYFTSGSTGEPKGAMCEHAGLLNHLYAKIDDLEIEAEQVVAQTAPQCFDISLWQLVAPLLAGARTLIVEQKDILDIKRYLDTIVDGGVEVLQVVPSYLEMLLSHLDEHPRSLGRLRCVSATGEALKKELVERWFDAYPEIKLVNAYGLTETSDDTNHEVMERVPEHDRVPLGRAIGNVSVYVVDSELNPVPLGAPGEIVFSGICVGRGYINDPERTVAAFGSDPHRPGERLYRSGDIGRWLPGGKLDFLGRKDSQVKIRGLRIEIGEIENRLLHAPGVRDAAVVVAEDTGGGKDLVAFYAADDELPASELEKVLAEALPEYMIPQRFRHRSTLPLTGNGKIDKKKLAAELREAADEETATGAIEPPATPTESRLAAAWARVLNIDVGRIGRSSNFFDIGGTSLSVVRLGVSLGRQVSLRKLVEHPVLRDLAVVLDVIDQAGEKEEE
ncbi:amino acid adenylation domain-containing protein [Saccharothrix sp. AJ9571]|nr:amino acid adenylation domain-containing protein [Saccharothrix sp. AJ9571]